MNTLTVYRALSYLKHSFSAWNTGGEGIHSPSLFYIVRFLFPRQHSYYIWEDIEDLRYAMLHAPKMLQITDYGTGKDRSLQVRQIARKHLESKTAGELFFKLLVHLKHELKRPLNIVELGTSLGLTTAYLAAADKTNRVVTYEGSEQTLEVARSNWKKLGLSNIESVLGNIDTTLINARMHEEGAKIDFLFMDANHRLEPTLQYFCWLKDCLHDKSIVVVDDIHHSPQMNKAWQELKKQEQVSSSIDCYAFGILFFDPHYLKRHYIIRL